jgi:ABC-type maltose transport system permease subunit
MNVVALMRPDEWDFPLFVHVLGAMILVGGLLTGASTLAFARGDTSFLRLGYWSLLAVALPGWIVMRIGAEWIYSEEDWDELPEGVDEPDWLDAGFVIANLGGLILLVTLIVGGVGVSRLRQGKGSGLLQATLVLSLILLAAYLIAAWAMAGKPGE